jgi:hypothetical protein
VDEWIKKKNAYTHTHTHTQNGVLFSHTEWNHVICRKQIESQDINSYSYSHLTPDKVGQNTLVKR